MDIRGLSNEELKHLEEKIKTTARSMGFIYEYDDLAQQVLLNWLAHPKWKQTIKFAIVDAARQTIHKGRNAPRPVFIPFEDLDNV